MILYKYTSLEAGTKILESQSIGFSEPRHFNDPFETAARTRDRSTEGFTILLQTPGGETVEANHLFGCHNHATNFWSSNFAVLSLTRQLLNKLLMAHYANEHRGMILSFVFQKPQISLTRIGRLFQHSMEISYIPLLSQRANKTITFRRAITGIGERKRVWITRKCYSCAAKTDPKIRR